MVYGFGLWLMVTGGWWMVDGELFMVSGSWFMVYASWFVFHSVWCMFYVFLVYSLCLMMYGEFLVLYVLGRGVPGKPWKETVMGTRASAIVSVRCQVISKVTSFQKSIQSPTTFDQIPTTSHQHRTIFLLHITLKPRVE